MYEWSELFKFDIIPFGRFVTFDNNEDQTFTLSAGRKYLYLSDSRGIKSIKMYIYNTSSLGAGYVDFTIYCESGLLTYSSLLTMLTGLTFEEVGSDNIKWGDGTLGKILSVTYTSDYTALTGIVVSHPESNTKVTQPTITYDTDGAVISKPEMIIEILN